MKTENKDLRNRIEASIKENQKRFETATPAFNHKIILRHLISDLKELNNGFDNLRTVKKIAANKGSNKYFYHPAAVEFAKERLIDLTK